MLLMERVKKKIQSIRQVWKNEAEPTISMSKIIELFSGKAYNEITDLGEITYFTCLKTLSESVGKMPVYLMDEEKRRVKFQIQCISIAARGRTTTSGYNSKVCELRSVLAE